MGRGRGKVWERDGTVEVAVRRNGREKRGDVARTKEKIGFWKERRHGKRNV